MTLAIDIGSNTIKCLLGENVEGRVEKLYESTLNCRISAGAGIIPDASRKIAQCVNFFISEAEEFCLNFDVKMVATSALRDSAKGGCICDDVFKLTGYRIKILSGDEEARLSYAGAMSDGAIDKSSESWARCGWPKCSVPMEEWMPKQLKKCRRMCAILWSPAFRARMLKRSSAPEARLWPRDF